MSVGANISDFKVGLTIETADGYRGTLEAIEKNIWLKISGSAGTHLYSQCKIIKQKEIKKGHGLPHDIYKVKSSVTVENGKRLRVLELFVIHSPSHTNPWGLDTCSTPDGRCYLKPMSKAV